MNSNSVPEGNNPYFRPISEDLSVEHPLNIPKKYTCRKIAVELNSYREDAVYILLLPRRNSSYRPIRPKYIPQLSIEVRVVVISTSAQSLISLATSFISLFAALYILLSRYALVVNHACVGQSERPRSIRIIKEYPRASSSICH